jgi:hypothetical protein
MDPATLVGGEGRRIRGRRAPAPVMEATAVGERREAGGRRGEEGGGGRRGGERGSEPSGRGGRP